MSTTKPKLSAEEAKRKTEQLRLMMEKMKKGNSVSLTPNIEEASRKRPIESDDIVSSSISEKPPFKASKYNEDSRPKPKENPYLAFSGKSIQESTDDAFVDDRIAHSDKRKTREKHALQFVPQGKYIEDAKIYRAREAHKAFINDKKSKDARRHFRELIDGVASATGHEKVDISEIIEKQHIPKMEWWDKPFLPKSMEDMDSKSLTLEMYDTLDVVNQKVYKFVEHPTYIKALAPPNANPRPIPLYLTKKERKRQRRLRRAEIQQDIRDRIAAGLLPAPGPKVKMSNIMRVLGDQAVADPSKMEKEVLEQVKSRVTNHEMRNQAAMLTPAEKWEKAQKKIALDNRDTPIATLYWIQNISSPPEQAASNRFKLDATAQKFGLTGCVIGVSLPDDQIGHNLVLTEGGPSGSSKFEKLITNRIKWPIHQGNPGVKKIWSGPSAKSFPSKFEFHDFPDVQQARVFCVQRGISHLWDMIM